MSWKLFGYGLCGILDIENLGDESRDKKIQSVLARFGFGQVLDVREGELGSPWSNDFCLSNSCVYVNTVIALLDDSRIGV